MPDVKDWIHDIKHTPAPPLWEDIERREVDLAADRDLRPRPLLAAAILAVTVVVLGSTLYGFGRLAGTNGREVPPAAGSTELSSDGVSVDVLAGWNGRFMPVRGFPQGVLVVSNLSLPASLNEDASQLRGQLRSGRDGLLWLVEYSALCPPCEDFTSVKSVDELRVASSELSGYPVRRFPLSVEPIENHAATSNLFELWGRYFDLRVEFGSMASDEAALAQVNAMIASISVEDPPRGEANGDCGGGRYLDPDCPDHTWLVDLLEHAGFTMAGDTGTALLAEKGSLVVTAWIADPEPPGLPVSAEPNEMIAGTLVISHDEDTVYWNTRSGRLVVFSVNTRNGQLDHPTLVDLVEASQRG